MSVSTDPWAVTTDEQVEYQHYFQSLNPRNGYVTGGQAKSFFLLSQLPQVVLGEIWALADTNADGKMNINEFSVACKLMNLKLRGFELPKVLPPILLASLSSVAGIPPPAGSLSTLASIKLMGNDIDQKDVSIVQPQVVLTQSFVHPLSVASLLPSEIVGDTIGLNGIPQRTMQQVLTIMPIGLDDRVVDKIETTPPAEKTVLRAPPIPPRKNSPSQYMSTSEITSSNESLQTEWAIKDDVQLKYTNIFNIHARNGYLTGLKARNLMVQTELPQATLAQIWALADMDSDGRLRCEEFILAMYLCEKALRGEEIPPNLPSDLIPTSSRKSDSSYSSNSGSIQESGMRSRCSSVLSEETVEDTIRELKLLINQQEQGEFESKKKEKREKREEPRLEEKIDQENQIERECTNLVKQTPKNNPSKPLKICGLLTRKRKILHMCLRDIAEQEKEGNLPHAQVEIYKEELSGILVNRATISCFGAGAEEFVNRNNLQLTGYSTIVNDADGTSQMVLGHISLPVKYKKQIKDIQFYIVPNLAQPLYLGKNFIESFEESLQMKWDVKDPTVLKYTELFNTTDLKRNGYLTGVQARKLMVETKLPEETLSKIWVLADIDLDGRLGCEEFILAMHLCDKALDGENIPTTLPPNLRPPSFRKTNLRHSVNCGSSEESEIESKSSSLSSEGEDKSTDYFVKKLAELDLQRKLLLKQQLIERTERGRLEQIERQKKEREQLIKEQKQQIELKDLLERQREIILSKTPVELLKEKEKEYDEACKVVLGPIIKIGPSKNLLKFRGKCKHKKKLHADLVAFLNQGVVETILCARIEIVGEHLVGVLVNGATSSCLGAGVEEFLKRNNLQLSPCQAKINTGDDTVYTSLGFISLPVKYKNETKDIQFYVIPDLPQPLYLATDFLKAFSFGESPQMQWAIKDAEKIKFTNLFNVIDCRQSGYLTRLQVRNLMIEAKLPRASLNQILKLADVDSNDRLGCEEFVLAMYLCDKALCGEELPTTLPFNLMPPSFKTIDSKQSSISTPVSSQCTTADPLKEDQIK